MASRLHRNCTATPIRRMLPLAAERLPGGLILRSLEGIGAFQYGIKEVTRMKAQRITALVATIGALALAAAPGAAFAGGGGGSGAGGGGGGFGIHEPGFSLGFGGGSGVGGGGCGGGEGIPPGGGGGGGAGGGVGGGGGSPIAVVVCDE